MQPSSSFCRTQEARQHALATGSDLANVRGVATLAAAAWAKQAVAAEKREERLLRRRETDAVAPGLFLTAGPDRDFSENPDRGFASPQIN
jgi:hypothetical protein